MGAERIDEPSSRPREEPVGFVAFATLRGQSSSSRNRPVVRVGLCVPCRTVRLAASLSRKIGRNLFWALVGWGPFPDLPPLRQLQEEDIIDWETWGIFGLGLVALVVAAGLMMFDDLFELDVSHAPGLYLMLNLTPGLRPSAHLAGIL